MYTNNLLKSAKGCFSVRNILITICVGFVWIVIYYSIRKQAFNGLLKVICIPTKIIKDNLIGKLWNQIIIFITFSTLQTALMNFAENSYLMLSEIGCFKIVFLPCKVLKYLLISSIQVCLYIFSFMVHLDYMLILGAYSNIKTILGCCQMTLAST